MEEIELRDALRRHVTFNEPPLGLTATGLLTRGRRRSRFRGALIGSGSAATALAVAGVLVVVPNGGMPSLSGSGCTVPIAESGWPSPYPTPDDPMNPSPWPTPEPGGTPSPGATNYPSFTPPPSGTLDPGGTVSPSGTTRPNRTAGPDSAHSPTANPTEPGFSPTALPPKGSPGTPSDLPLPGGGSALPDPSPTGQAPKVAPNRERMLEMECYLKREMQRLLPEARFAPFGGVDAPLTVYSQPGAWEGAGAWVYYANANIVDRSAFAQLTITVEERHTTPDRQGPGWNLSERDGKIMLYLSDGSFMHVAVYTRNTTISISGHAIPLTGEQLATMALAQEMDMFR